MNLTLCPSQKYDDLIEFDEDGYPLFVGGLAFDGPGYYCGELYWPFLADGSTNPCYVDRVENIWVEQANEAAKELRSTPRAVFEWILLFWGVSLDTVRNGYGKTARKSLSS